MKKGILIILLLVHSVHIYSQNKCSSLRQPNENYGAGDNNTSWCQMSKPTPYTKCLCEDERERKTQEEQRIAENENFNSETNRLKNLEEQAANNKDYVAAISHLSERIKFVTKSNRYQNAEPFYKDEMTKTFYAQLKHYQYKLEGEKGNESKGKNTSISPDINSRKSQTTTNSTQTSSKGSISQEQQAAQNFIDGQNRQLADQEAFKQKIEDDLVTKFNAIADSWAKERDFQSIISSLTNIKSIDASSIISEAKYKANKINIEYNQKKEDGLNQGLANTQNVINSAQNEEQVVAGTIVGVGLTALAQANIEKERKEAQQKLEDEKQRALNKLAKQIVDEYTPVKEQHLEAATLSVSLSNESYHLTKYEYAKCMETHAYDIVVEGFQCAEPVVRKSTREVNTSFAGQDYYNSYKRKSRNSLKQLRDKAPYFLELALEKEPQNAEWLYEKTLVNGLSIFDKTSILKKAYDSDPENEKINRAYKNAVKKVKSTIEAEQQEIKYTLYERPDHNWKMHSSLMRMNYRDGYAFINSRGEVQFTITHEYHFSNHLRFKPEDDFNGGLLRVYDKNGKCGFLDTKGEIAIPLIYENATHFVEGLAAVEDIETGKWAYINTKGDIELPFDYFNPKPFSEGLAFAFKVTRRDSNGSFYGHPGYINKEGELVFTGKFKQGGPFINGIAIVTRAPKNDSFMGGGNQKVYFVDKEGNRLSKDDYFYASPFNDNGYASVSKGGVRWEIINKEGTKQHKGSFYEEPYFYEGKARVNIGNYKKQEYVYIDETGKIIERE